MHDAGQTHTGKASYALRVRVDQGSTDPVP